MASISLQQGHPKTSIQNVKSLLMRSHLHLLQQEVINLTLVNLNILTFQTNIYATNSPLASTYIMLFSYLNTDCPYYG